MSENIQMGAYLFLLIQNFPDNVHIGHGIHNYGTEYHRVFAASPPECGSGYETFAGFSLKTLNRNIDLVQLFVDLSFLRYICLLPFGFQ